MAAGRDGGWGTVFLATTTGTGGAASDVGARFDADIDGDAGFDAVTDGADGGAEFGVGNNEFAGDGVVVAGSGAVDVIDVDGTSVENV